MKRQYEPLFEAFKFASGVEVKNRIAVAPMTTWSGSDDGSVTEEELAYYSRRANGPGLFITACAYVTAGGKGFSGQIAADTDRTIASLARIAAVIQAQGAKAVLQIYHGGSQCPPELVSGDVVSAGIVATSSGAYSRELSNMEIELIIRDFGEATRRAIEAGFDGVEIHGANGYLLHQFLSEKNNQRTDRWGGSLNNRMAFPLAVADAVIKAARQHARSPFLVGYRFSPEEAGENGFTMEDSLALIDELANRELDYLHASLDNFWSLPRRGASDTHSRLHWISRKVNGRVPVMGVGAIHTAIDAARALETGVPLIALGRELLADPDWVNKIAEGREEEIDTEMGFEDRERLTIPETMWANMVSRPGWLPFVNSAQRQ